MDSPVPVRYLNDKPGTGLVHQRIDLSVSEFPDDPASLQCRTRKKWFISLFQLFKVRWSKGYLFGSAFDHSSNAKTRPC